MEGFSGEVLEEVHLTEDGGVIKRIYAFGDEQDPKPETGQTVHASYEGRLENGKVFDSSTDPSSAFTFTIGEGQVIKGWDIGMASMRIGEKAELYLKPEYAYGEQGAGADIPPNSSLIFKVEIHQIDDVIAKKLMVSDAELYERGLSFKDQGNGKFKTKEFSEAHDLYVQAMQNLDKIKEESKESNDLKKTVLQNLSVACNNLGKFKDTIEYCSQALYFDDKAVKALYLRAQARGKLNDFDEALNDIKEAIKLSPADQNLRTEFENLKKQRQAKLQTQQKAMQNMFSAGLYNEKNAPVVKKDTGLPDFNLANPQTFFDLTIGEEGSEDFQKGRVVFELFNSQVPKTAENFRSICAGDKGLSYKSNIFHRVITGFMMQGGDITNQNGTGGKSIYGNKFADEGVWMPHTTPGLLSMANSGPDTNGSQFFITFKETPWLDGKHTVFGRVISGMELVKKVEEIKTEAGDKPTLQVQIVECGELKDDEKIMESED